MQRTPIIMQMGRVFTVFYFYLVLIFFYAQLIVFQEGEFQQHAPSRCRQMEKKKYAFRFPQNKSVRAGLNTVTHIHLLRSIFICVNTVKVNMCPLTLFASRMASGPGPKSDVISQYADL